MIMAVGDLPALGLLMLVAACGYLGFAVLALSQARHWQGVRGGGSTPPRPALRGAGVLGLAASLAAAIVRDGAGFGALLWGVAASLAALAVVATLTWRARWLAPLARTFGP